MPTLPHGNTCFKWTDLNSTSHQWNLDWPIHLEPGGFETGHDKTRHSRRSIDRRTWQVASISGGVYFIRARIRFASEGLTLINFLSDAADGVDVTFEPTCGGTPSYTVQIPNAAEVLDRVSGDIDLFARDQRYQTPPIEMFRPDGGDFSEIV